MKLTPWFPGTVKPGRKGVYQRHARNNLVLWSRWNGEKWMRSMFFIPSADAQVVESEHQELPWRGVAK